MLFTLKKVIGNMLLPLPLMLLIIGAGLALLWFSRFQKTGKIFISIGWLALLLLSLQPVADRLLRPIESTYPTWNNSQKVDYIVVLGGGYTWNPQWAPSSNLINNSLPRLNEGIRLWRENPGSKLIFTGGVAKTNTLFQPAALLFQQLFPISYNSLQIQIQVLLLYEFLKMHHILCFLLLFQYMLPLCLLALQILLHLFYSNF